MRLSEAIRLGAMLGPQCFGDGFGPNNATCAIGAALLAAGQKDSSVSIWEVFPITSLPYKCPVCGAGSNYLHIKHGFGWAITHLNDAHRWTRERIADWVEGEERRLGYFDAPAVSLEIAPAEVAALESLETQQC